MRLTRTTALFLIAAFACVVYWPLLTGYSALKWDNIDQFMLFRRYFVDCVRHGILPVWQPSINLGYPFMADPQSGAWYPIVWIFSLFGRYGFQSINLEWLLHAILSGWGMYYLGRVLRVERLSAIIMGMAYLASGFFVGTAQILPFIIGATWLPWIVASWVRFKQVPSFKHALLLVLSLAMCVTGAYPAFTIILAYFLLVAFFVWAMGTLRKDGARTLWNQGKFLIPAGILLILMLIGHLMSIYTVSPLVGRGSDLVLKDSFFEGSFGWQGYLTFIVPFINAGDFEWFKADLSLVNAYVGWVVFLGALIGLFNRSNRRINSIVLLTMLIAAALGLSAELPFRKLFHLYVPGFGLFRHPGIFRLYILFGLIILFGLNFKWIIERRRVLTAFLIGAVALPLAGLLFTTFPSWSEMKSLWVEYPRLPEFSPLSMKSRAGVQLIILVLIHASAWMIWRIWSHPRKVLFLLIGLDLFLAVQLNSSTTIYNQEKIAGLESALNAYPFQIDAPLDVPISEFSNEKAALGIPLIWRNESFISGKIAADGYNPFQLKSFNRLEESDQWEEYLSRSFLHFESKDSTTTFEVNDFQIGPNEIKFGCLAGSAGEVHVLQNKFPLWRLEMNEPGKFFFIQDSHTLAFHVREGEHYVRIKLDTRPYLLLTMISVSAWIISILLLIWLLFRSKSISSSPHTSHPE